MELLFLLLLFVAASCGDECPAGTYRPHESVSACYNCPSGSTSESGSDSQYDCVCPPGFQGLDGFGCFECEEYTYKSEYGSAACQTCPLYMWSPVQSDDITDCICIAGFTGEAGVECSACPSGTYKDSIGPTNCTDCPANTQSHEGSNDLSDCICAPGYFGAAGTECTACPVGYYKSAAGSHACTSCPYYAVTDTTAATSRDECHCLPGWTTFDVDGNCDVCSAGTYKEAAGGDPCTPCPAHATSPAMSSNATACECLPGYAATSVEDGVLQTCTRCDYNYYKSSTANEVCTACPANTQSAPASDDVSDCMCSAGFAGEDGGPCTACAEGTYADAAGLGTCATCPLNSTTLAAASTSIYECMCMPGYQGLDGSDCEVCPAATYKSSYGDESCSSCPNHSGSPEGSTNVTACLCDPGYVGEPGGFCSECPEGTYSDTSGSTSCTTCPENSSSPVASDDLSQCVCDQGYYGPPGGPCTPCAADTYQMVTGQESCLACPEFTTTDGSIGNVFIGNCMCIPGYVGPNSGPCSACDANTYKSTVGQESCQQCPNFSESPAQSDNITDCVCSAGYTGENGGTCDACPVGTYKNETGDASCSVCPGGSTTLYSGSTSATDCVCMPGYDGPSGGPCTACEAGSYKDSLSSEEVCAPCPANSTSDAGSTDVADCTCLPGYHGRNGESCEICPAYFYKDVSGQTSCSVCPNFATSSPGSTALSDCQCIAGYTGEDGGECVACAAGTYKDSVGSSACTACPDGASSPARSDSLDDCVCNEGKYWNGAACEDCTGGTYKDTVGDEPSLCYACPALTTSVAGATAKSDCVCEAGYYGWAGGPCTACPLGSYKEASGTDGCSQCPNYFTTATEASTSSADCISE